jgi:hypothetical protein
MAAGTAEARADGAGTMILSKSAGWTARRARAAQQQGRPQGPEGSLGKLAASHVARACSRVHTLTTGTQAMLTGRESPREGITPKFWSQCRPCPSPEAPTRFSATS